eukprot:tig00021036_g17285.t1
MTGALGGLPAFRVPRSLWHQAPGNRGTRNEAPRMWWSTWSGAGGWDKWAMALRGWRCELAKSWSTRRDVAVAS